MTEEEKPNALAPNRDVSELASLLTTERLADNSVGEPVLKYLTAGEIKKELWPGQEDLLCGLLQAGARIHNDLCLRLRSDMDLVFRDTAERAVLRAGLITLWRADSYIIVDGFHRYLQALDKWPEVPLPCLIVELKELRPNFKRDLLFPHAILSNLVSKTFSDELRILALTLSVEYRLKMYYSKGIVPTLSMLMGDVENYWGEAINPQYIQCVLWSIERAYDTILPKSKPGPKGSSFTDVNEPTPRVLDPKGQVGTPTRDLHPEEREVIQRFAVDGIPRKRPYPAVQSLRALVEERETNKKAGNPSQPERLHFRTGYNYSRTELQAHIQTLESHGFPISTYYQLNQFADWAYMYALEQVEKGSVTWNKSLPYIGTETASYELIKDSLCPLCKDHFWVVHNPLAEDGKSLKCNNRRHFVTNPNGLSFAPTVEKPAKAEPDQEA